MKEKYFLTYLPTEDDDEETEETLKKEAEAAALAYRQIHKEQLDKEKPKHYIITIYEYKPSKVERPRADQPEIQNVWKNYKPPVAEPEKNYNDPEYWKSIKSGSVELLENIENGFTTDPDVLLIFKGGKHVDPNSASGYSLPEINGEADNSILGRWRQQIRDYQNDWDWQHRPDHQKIVTNMQKLATAYAKKYAGRKAA